VTDLFSGLQSGTARFDAILSNPPYIGDAEFPDLAPEVREHEPELALRGGGPEGIDVPARILAEFDRYMKPGGALLMEIGHSQRDLLTGKARHLTGAPKFEFHKDYSDFTRILHITAGSR
jgi:release factor glutamine methyltransferase